MALIGWLLVTLLGYSVINSISREFSWLEKLGFAFPVGIGITSLLMFLFNVIGFWLNDIVIVWGGIVVVIAALFFANRKTFDDLPQFVSLEDLKKLNRRQFHFAWIFLVACIAAVSFMIILKGQFWGVFIYDSVAGYDFLARAIAHEGTIHNSIFDSRTNLYTVRDLYPPLAPLAFAFAYVSQNGSSQIVITLFFISTTISFYALLVRFTTHFAAALFTLLLITAPQLASFFSLSSSSVPCAFYCSAAIICLFIWYEEDNDSYFLLGTLLMVFALWTRSESIALDIAASVFVLLKSLRKKKISYALYYFSSCIIVFASWQFYLANVLAVGSEQPVIRHLYFDDEKLWRMLQLMADNIFRIDLYGIIIYVFLAAMLLNWRTLFSRKSQTVLLAVIFFALLLLTAVYYQINVSYADADSESYINSGFVRSMFSFLPVMLFYSVKNERVQTFFKKVERWMSDIK